MNTNHTTQRIIYALCMVAIGVIMVLIGMENSKQQQTQATEHDNAVFIAGMAQGYQLSRSAAADKAITDATCMAWWFNGDTQRTAKAIKKAKAL